MKIKLTNERKMRIVREIEDCNRRIAKEMKYSEDLRHHDEISRLEAHIERIAAMLDMDEIEL